MFLAKNNIEVTSLDTGPQPSSRRLISTVDADVQDPAEISRIFSTVQPSYVFHLAARTDNLSSKVGDYQVNWTGTENVVRAVSKIDGARLIHVSTQMVAGPGVNVSNPLTFAPFTAYGESKVKSERVLRREGSMVDWVIVRPSNIWGPGHPNHRREILQFISQRIYFEPRGTSGVRAYGFVGNFVHQLYRIATSHWDDMRRRVWYGGDANLPVSTWSDAISVALTKSEVRRFPRWLVAGAAGIGEIAQIAGFRAPFYWSRYKNMVQDYKVPVEKTVELVGQPHFSLEDAAELTAKAFRGEHLESLWS